MTSITFTARRRSYGEDSCSGRRLDSRLVLVRAVGRRPAWEFAGIEFAISSRGSRGSSNGQPSLAGTGAFLIEFVTSCCMREPLSKILRHWVPCQHAPQGTAEP